MKIKDKTNSNMEYKSIYIWSEKENRKFESIFGVVPEIFMGMLSIYTLLALSAQLKIDLKEEEKARIILQQDYTHIIRLIMQTAGGAVALQRELEHLYDAVGYIPSHLKVAIDAYKDMCPDGLEYKDIKVRPITAHDIPVLITWMSTSEYQKVEQLPDEVDKITVAQMVDLLNSAFNKHRDAQMMIEHNGEPIGTIYTYNRSVKDRHVYTSVFLNDRAHAVALRATLIFLNWYISEYSMRKVYAEVYGDNTDVLNMLQKAGAEVEGVLRDYRCDSDSCRDLHIYAMSTDKLSNLYERYIV